MEGQRYKSRMSDYYLCNFKMWITGWTALGALLAVHCSSLHMYSSSASDTGGFQLQYRHSNKSYAYFSIPLTYGEARLVCKATGGQLAIIRDAETNAFITNLRSRVNNHGYWIRIKDWGSHADYDLPVFSGWSNGLPKRGRSSTGKDRCPYLSPDLQLDWHDADCNNASMLYICQYENGEPKSSEQLACMQKGGPCFEVVHATSTRLDAESDCIKRGGSLALIGTKETHDFLKSIIHKNRKYLKFNKAVTSPGVRTWAGVHLVPRHWTYVDGTPLQYTSWNSSQPGNSEGKDCASLYEAKWYGYTCSEPLMYICEYPKEASPNSTYCLDDKCYQYVERSVPYDVALENCEKSEGNLAMPKTAEINALLNSIYQNDSLFSYRTRATIWIGAHLTPRFFEYSNGTPLTFTAWASRQLDNLKNIGESCVAIADDHKWYDVPCDKKNAFICEYKGLIKKNVKIENQKLHHFTPIHPRGHKQKDCLACKHFCDEGICKLECPPMQRYNPTTYSWESNPEGKYAYEATCVKKCPEHLLKDNGTCVHSCPPTKKPLGGECVPCDGPCPKICIGTEVRMSVPKVAEGHYQNMRDRYTNCTYVDGNLEITWIEDKNLTFLQHIREVTGYVLIFRVKGPRLVLPNLQIIRGRTLFKLPVRDGKYALLVAHNDMESLELPALRDILAGDVGVLSNINLCHLRTINWDEIISGPKAIYDPGNSEDNRKCSCHEKCNGRCWAEGEENCQRFSKINCSPQCHGGRCYGPLPRNCCHLFCAAGCTGPKQTDCLACKNFYDDGVCKLECPPMQRYNPTTYSWDSNPDGKYAYGATCVKNCPDHLLKDNGACVRSCPPMKKPLGGECVPCDGPCPKTCQNPPKMIHSGNIKDFKDCTVIDGSIQILQSSFTGFQEFHANFSFGTFYAPMQPESLEVFSTLKEVTGYIDIQGTHENFTSLSYLRNLEVIGGRSTSEFFSSLYIVKSSLKTLGLRSLKAIRSGNIVILENPNLCLAETINWGKIKKNAREPMVETNKDFAKCLEEGLVCHKECSDDGCWGPLNTECFSCKHYSLGDMCVESCTTEGTYYVNATVCDYCHRECNGSCFGSGSDKCTVCTNVKDGPYCVPACPALKVAQDGVCMPCHPNCIEGCTGTGSFFGDGGCDACEKIIQAEPGEKPQCLKDEPCPSGYYTEWTSATHVERGPHQTVCKKCHPRCKNCTGYGFHLSVCHECVRYHSSEQCEDNCPSDHYADEESMSCEKCSEECRECYGPGTLQCKACRNYRVYLENNGTLFNCTATCPTDQPFKTLPEDGGDPVCTSEDPLASSPFGREEGKLGAIIGGVLGCLTLIGIFMAGFVYQWRQRAKSKENTVKMTLRMTGLEDSEPLKPTNVKPNLAKLRIITESELRRGSVLGYGAFGVVYKGVWVPENENIKIPVAIKVLKEGTGTNTNKEILEEAYMMASVEHPNLVKLLAICMTSQTMLVTQLMPLGCLLDYVRNNKDKIGSKPLLNWCTQIAKGMAHLEDKRLVHRDLAARNVLVQMPGCVKITDFGLTKLLDTNEDEYKAAGGKMPIKWLALECIQHRRFTHKSDVWAFGVTVWELLTYGGRPYENIAAREVPDLLEKGERLPQPSICTIDVYMIMIKCWMLDAESRPSFRELAEEFAKMARDPGRYLVIAGDKLMRLPDYTSQDEKELLRTLSVSDGPEVFMDAEEYLQPKSNNHVSSITTTTGSATPPSIASNKFYGPHPQHLQQQQQQPHQPTYGISNEQAVTNSPHVPSGRQDRKYAHLEAAVANSPHLRHREDSMNSRYSSDPLKLLGKELDSDHPVLMNGTPGYNKRDINKVGDLKLDLPIDEEDYLMPSPQPVQTSMYMDLIGDSRVADSVEGRNKDNLWHVPDFVPMNNNMLGLDNPEYHIVSEPRRNQLPVNGVRRKTTSSEDDSDHEYYNDFDGLRSQLQPLNQRRNATTV